MPSPKDLLDESKIAFAPEMTELRKTLTSHFYEDETGDYLELLQKLDDITHTIFKKGAFEAGYMASTLHYNLWSKDAPTSKIALQHLHRLTTTYFQSLHLPANYSVFFHTYNVRWFRLVIVLDGKAREFFHWLGDATSLEELIDYNKFLDNPFNILPCINPEMPLPEVSTEDRALVQELFVKHQKSPTTLGTELAKFYNVLIKRILYSKEELAYLLQVQTVIGDFLAKVGNETAAFVMEGVGWYYFNLNRELKKVLAQLADNLTDEDLEVSRRKWVMYNKFSGTSFSEVVRQSKNE